MSAPLRLLALVSLLLLLTAASAQGSERAPGEIIVGYDDSATQADRAEITQDLDAEVAARPLPGTQLLELEEPGSVSEALQRARELEGVAYAQPNRIVYAAAAPTPTDPYFSKQWALHNTGQRVGGVNGTPGADIGALDAWATNAGTASTVVAVVDSGVQISHPDLAAGIWTNPGEIASNGLDDDSNGKIDDSRGWDFISSDPNPEDGNGHGTHVAGIVAARAFNSEGGVGVAPQATVMPIRALNNSGEGTDAGIAAAFRYAAREGADVINASLGGDGASPVIRDVVSDHPNTLFVFAAGNEGKSLEGVSYDPCTAPGQNVICVAATDSRDGLASFSNYGASAVDIGAPGDTILSSYPGSSYAYMSGTSMAAPVTAGAAAVLISERPSLSAAATRQLLISSSAKLGSLQAKTSSGGRVDLARAITASVGPTPPPPPAASPPATRIVSHPRKRTSSRSATFRFASDQAGASFRCKLDRRRWTKCFEATRVVRLIPGKHKLLVAAQTAAGADPTPASFRWRVIRRR